jgi:sigma-B regulation protein RsbU (phosphoserine phosphatase)
MTARLAAYLRRQPPALLTAAGMAGIAALAFIDWIAPPDLSFLIFYVGPVLFLVWFVGRWAGFLGAAASAGFWAWEDVLSTHAYPSVPVADWNIAVRLIFLVAFVAVVAALKESVERERQASQERLERDVQIAQEVQARLFPQKVPKSGGLECDGVCRPARGVAGDYYDFLEIDRGHLGIALGDVAGKGISAALLMASLQGALRSHASLSDGGPADAASDINAQIHALTDAHRFATFFWAIFDEARRTLTYVNAGHNPPMLLRASGALERLTVGGPPLGVFADSRYRQDTVALASGDLLVVYSDGITEAPDPADDEFGEPRLERVLRANAKRPAGALCGAVLSAVEAFQSGTAQVDDMTVVAARVLWPASP